jgi:hypothetical protein
MLTKKQRRSVVRALTKAYYGYRRLSYLRVCRQFGISLTKNSDEARGEANPQWHNPEVLHNISIPGKASRAYKEHVFWHEFAHLVIAKCAVFESPLVGLQGHMQMFRLGTDYWEQERLCEAFADAVLLHRYRLLEDPSPAMEKFLSADTNSIGYAEVMRFSARRIATFAGEARAERRNVDLPALDRMLKLAEKVIANCAHQQRLPTHFYEHHQCPGPRFVDEDADLERRYLISKGKESWRWAPPEVTRLLKWACMLTLAHDQLSLFEGEARLDRTKLEKALGRFERAVKKYERS